MNQHDCLIITDEIHNRSIRVFDDKKACKDAIEGVYNRHFDDWAEGDSSILNTYSFVCYTYNPETKYNDILVYFNPDRLNGCSEDYFFRVIVHECNHAAVHVLNDVGIEISFENQESMAYLSDYITGKVLRWMRPRWHI